MITIGVSGKGGTGKTTLCGLIITILLREGKKPILAVDGDPNSTLCEILGLNIPKTLVEIVEEVEKVKNTLPIGMDKSQYLEFKLKEAIKEEEGFDILVMGKTEGPGCYCYANHLLRDFMDRLSRNYSFIVMDNEAGLEHLSRRTTRDIDIFFITSLCNMVSIRSAERIYNLSKKLDLNIKKTYLVLNEFGNNKLLNYNFSNFLEPAFKIPFDEELLKRSEEGKGILDIPKSSLAYNTVRENLLKILKFSLTD